MNIKRLVGSNRRSFILKLFHGATTNIELFLSYVVLRVGQMSYTAWLYVSITEYGFICPPILQQGFHVLAACVPLAHFLSELKGYAPPSTHCLCQTDANAFGVKNLITVLVFRVEVAKYFYLHSRLLELMAYGCPPPYNLG